MPIAMHKMFLLGRSMTNCIHGKLGSYLVVDKIVSKFEGLEKTGISLTACDQIENLLLLKCSRWKLGHVRLAMHVN